MLQGLIAAVLVFPIAAIVPATPVHLNIHWLMLLTLAPLAGWVAAALGLVLGTRVAPAARVVPVRPGGAAAHVPRLPSTTRGRRSRPCAGCRSLVLVNPLVYMCEGFRAALVGVPHMSLWAVYGAWPCSPSCSPGSASRVSSAASSANDRNATLTTIRGQAHAESTDSCPRTRTAARV